MSAHFNDFTSTIRLTQNVFGKERNYGICSNGMELHFYEVSAQQWSQDVMGSLAQGTRH